MDYPTASDTSDIFNCNNRSLELGMEFNYSSAV